MDDRIQAVFDGLRERMECEARLFAELPRAELMGRIDEFMLPIGPEAGGFLNWLIKAANFRAVLEIGTSVGFHPVAGGSGARHRRAGDHPGGQSRQA